jgi:hypothetical protein
MVKVEPSKLAELGCLPPGVALPVKKDGIDITSESGVKAQWMDVTPAIATKWLKNNFRNRPVSEDVVNAYARDMINGVWVPTHQGIAFNNKDELIDGQHRLLAVVKSGRTIRMMVTFGLPAKIEGHEMTTMDAVDRGRTRSVGDQLTIQHGLSNGSMTAAICSALSSLCYGERTRRLSVGQTLEVFRAFEPAVLYVIERRSKKAGLKSTGVLAGFTFALMPEFTGNKERPFWRGEAPTPVAQMFEQLTRDEKNAPPAIKKLREFLTSDEAKLITRSLDRGLAEMTLQAIHTDLQGKPCPKLMMLLEGANHFREIQKSRVEKLAGMFRLPKTQESGKA